MIIFPYFGEPTHPAPPSFNEPLRSEQESKKPHLCPVCVGRGLVQRGFYNVGNVYDTTDATPEVCKTCGGNGIVWEP